MILYSRWCQRYEQMDPEPPLDKIVHNRRLADVGHGWHYDHAQAEAHTEWHNRFWAAFMRDRDQITFDPNRETSD